MKLISVNQKFESFAMDLVRLPDGFEKVAYVNTDKRVFILLKSLNTGRYCACSGGAVSSVDPKIVHEILQQL